MLEDWNNVIVTDINLAIYVAPETGTPIHNNRPFHGFVINDSTADKVIYFSNGTVIHCGPNDVHYLPKGSSYRVENCISGGCWAINFNLLDEINEKPFNIKFRNHESILKVFKDAIATWTGKSDIIIRKSIYDIILKIKMEQQRNYMPSKKELLIHPAVEIIEREFTRNDLSVQELASLCGISEAYFRRIFIGRFSVTPKEYIIGLRIDYAKRLLECTQFTVSEIASMCGYYESCHFSREFKKHCGISPNEYIKASRNYELPQFVRTAQKSTPM